MQQRFINLIYMVMKGSLKVLWVVLGLWVVAAGCGKKDKVQFGELTMGFVHQWESADFNLNQAYTTPSGENFTPQQLKYYVSNINLTTTDGRQVSLPDQYFLVDVSKAESQTLSLKLPVGSYSNLEYLVGVDSTRNVSGVQEGALDPANGMFWTWNSGYIMARLEGTSPQSTAPFQKVTYHIGGFRKAESVLKPVVLNLPSAAMVTLQGKPRIGIVANLSKGFKST